MRANQDLVAVDRIHWESVSPAFQVLHAAKISFGLRMMLPALLAVMITDLAVRVFPEHASATPLEHLDGQNAGNSNPISMAVTNLSGIAVPAPARQLFRDMQSLLIGGLLDSGSRWLRMLVHLAVLSFFGVTMCCTAASSFCQQHSTNLRASVRRASGAISAMSVSASLSLLLIFVPLCLLRITQWLADWTGLWQLLPSVVFAAFWLSALLIVLITVVVATGWSLGICAIATDRCSGADALSRGINFVLSHPLRSVLYGMLLLLTIVVASSALQAASDFAVSLVIGFDSAYSDSQVPSDIVQGDDSTPIALTMRTLPKLFVEAYRLAIFFCGLTIAYVLLRQQEDAVDLAELQNSL